MGDVVARPLFATWPTAQAPTTIYYLEPIGGHGGMVHYDMALCGELARLGQHRVVWATCADTIEGPGGVTLWPVLGGIYGERPRWLRGLSYVKGLCRLLQDFQHRGGAGVLHLHFFDVPPADYWLARQFKRAGGRVVITAHDLVPFDASRLSRVWIRPIYGAADHIIVHANHTRSQLVEQYGYPIDQVSVIPQGNYAHLAMHACKHTSREARELLALGRFGKLLLFFGTIRTSKGLDVLLRAMPRIVELHPDVGLVVAGRVRRQSDSVGYERLVSEFDLKDFVAMHLRYVPDDEAALYFQAADLAVLPYRETYNSAVVFTAISYACPVVATNCGGIPEVIEDGITGYLVPPENCEALASCVSRVLADPLGARKVAASAYEHVTANFEWSRTAQRTLAVYDKVLSTR